MGSCSSLKKPQNKWTKTKPKRPLQKIPKQTKQSPNWVSFMTWCGTPTCAVSPAQLQELSQEAGGRRGVGGLAPALLELIILQVSAGREGRGWRSTGTSEGKGHDPVLSTKERICTRFLPLQKHNFELSCLCILYLLCIKTSILYFTLFGEIKVYTLQVMESWHYSPAILCSVAFFPLCIVHENYPFIFKISFRFYEPYREEIHSKNYWKLTTP